MKRPIGVTILAGIAILLALFSLFQALQWLGLFPGVGSGPQFRTFNLWYAFMYGLLAYIYFWLTQMLLKLDESAWIFLAVITIFNLLINFVSLVGGTPSAWVAPAILLNGLVLLYMMLPGTRRAFGRQ